MDVRSLEHPYFAHRFAALAHRGGHCDEVPIELENTVEAFAAALACGYRYLETDVHATADGVLVAFHDDQLDRVTDRTGSIATLPHSEVAGARVAGRAGIPTMAQLLETFPEALFNIDLKTDAAVEPLVEVLRRHRATGRVCVGSFSTVRLNRFRHLIGSEVATSATPTEIAAQRAASLIGLGLGIRGLAYQIPVKHRGVPLVTRSFVAAAHRAGRVVHVWTINDRDEMNRFIDLGVDGIVSDDIETLRNVCVARGLWEEP